eukprot:3310475-Rhodomonas_salina.1
MSHVAGRIAEQSRAEQSRARAERGRAERCRATPRVGLSMLGNTSYAVLSRIGWWSAPLSNLECPRHWHECTGRFVACSAQYHVVAGCSASHRWQRSPCPPR